MGLKLHKTEVIPIYNLAYTHDLWGIEGRRQKKTKQNKISK